MRAKLLWIVKNVSLPSCIYYEQPKFLKKSVSLKMLQFVSLRFVPMCLNRRLSIVSKFHLYRIPSEAPRLQSALYFSFSITLSISNFTFSTVNIEASFTLLQSLFQFVISRQELVIPFFSHCSILITHHRISEIFCILSLPYPILVPQSHQTEAL